MTAPMPSEERKEEKSPSVNKKAKNPQTAATANCKNTITFASIFSAKMPVVTIWQANKKAQPSVIKSPILKAKPSEKLIDRMPMPSRHRKEETMPTTKTARSPRWLR